MFIDRNCLQPISLMNRWRKLWQEHVMWTRSFIISTAAELGDLDLVTERLMQNPGDMAGVIRPFYGDETADIFQKLFTEHLSIAGELVHAAKEGDSTKAAALEQKWYDNADEIASFLAKINPHWNRWLWQSLLHDHLKMTKQEALHRLAGEYAEDIRIYDSIEKEALQMADYMTNGILRQFRIR